MHYIFFFLSGTGDCECYISILPLDVSLTDIYIYNIYNVLIGCIFIYHSQYITHTYNHSHPMFLIFFSICDFCCTLLFIKLLGKVNL